MFTRKKFNNHKLDFNNNDDFTTNCEICVILDRLGLCTTLSIPGVPLRRSIHANMLGGQSDEAPSTAPAPSPLSEEEATD